MTEGNGALSIAVRLEDLRRGDRSGVGCVGRIPPPWDEDADEESAMATNFRFARYDVDEDELVRDPSTGFLIPCGPDEPGEALMKVTESPTSKFVGYRGNAKATEKKMVRDAFRKGDLYVRSGDLLSVDRGGWVRFVDRVGDTFRWKGENCSTFEVATELEKCPLLAGVNVVGVVVPGRRDGRAPLACCTMEGGPPTPARLAEVLAHARKVLAPYQVPVFLRVLRDAGNSDTTGTFKFKKTRYRKEGCDPGAAAAAGDQLFWLDGLGRGKAYVAFTAKDYEALVAQGGGGRARL